MSNVSGGTNTYCPFYICERERTITCEGVNDDCQILQRFGTVTQRFEHQQKYCFTKNYMKCPIANAANFKYGGGENEHS